MPANVHHLEGGTIEGDRSDVRITQLHATKVDSSQSRSSRSRAFDRRPLNLVALRDETKARCSVGAPPTRNGELLRLLLLSFRSRRFLGPLGHPCIIFRRAAARRW